MFENNSTQVLCCPILYEPGTTVFYLYAYLHPILILFGIGGNILNLIVLLKMKLQCTWFLQSMALADILFFSAASVFYSNVYETWTDIEAFSRVYSRMAAPALIFSHWFAAASIWSASMVTMERLTAIMKPLTIRMLWNKGRIWTTIVCIWAVAFLYNAHYWPAYSLDTKHHCNRSSTCYHYEFIEFQNPWKQYQLALKSSAPFVVIIVPFLIMLILNVRIIWHLHYGDEQGVRRIGSVSSDRSNTSSNAERRITITIVVITVAFIIFTAPSAAFHIVAIFKRNILQNGTVKTLAKIINFMTTVSKVLNFPLYCLSSQHFRSRLVQMLPRRCFNVSNVAGTMFSSIRSRSMTIRYSSVSRASKKLVMAADDHDCTPL